MVDDHARAVTLQDDSRDAVALVPHHGDEVLGIKRARGRQHVADERHPRQRVQHLRRLRLHAGARAGGEHDDGELRVGHAFILSHSARSRGRSAATAITSATERAIGSPITSAAGSRFSTRRS